MIRIYGRLLNETATWWLFAPARRLDYDPPLDEPRLVPKRIGSLQRDARYGLDAIRTSVWGVRHYLRRSNACSATVQGFCQRWREQRAASRQLRLF